MKIKGLKPTFVPTVPEMLKHKIEFKTTTNLNEYDAKVFTYALIKFEEQIIEEGIDVNRMPKAFAIFTDEGNIEISIDKGILGTNVHLLTFAIKRWEEYNLCEVYKVSVFLEELCHWFWNIDDETEVKYKIFEVLKRIYPTVKFNEVFNIKSLR